MIHSVRPARLVLGWLIAALPGACSSDRDKLPDASVVDRAPPLEATAPREARTGDRAAPDRGAPDLRAADRAALVPDYGLVASCAAIGSKECFASVECAAGLRCHNVGTEWCFPEK